MNDKNKQRGGPRQGAGRPKGTGKFNEPTRAIRVPEGSVTYIEDFLQRYPDVTEFAAISGNSGTKLAIPLYSSRVAAGYPSPADEHIDDTLDLNDFMVQRPDSTFMLQVEGESMKDAGILPGDMLIVDRSINATHNKIVIAALDGELTVKRLFHRGGLIKLMPENNAYPEIEIEHESQLVIWGVVTGNMRRF